MSEIDEEEGHTSSIKTPKQLITVLVSAFLFPVLTIILLAQLVTGPRQIDQDDPIYSDEAVAKRLKPVGRLIVASDSPQADENVGVTSQTAGAVAAPAAAADGADRIKTIYTASCAACHTSGAAGAPKLGDKSTWASRIKSGTDTLYNSALKGKNAMPAKGGNASLSDADVKAVVDYMVSQAK
ncbi:cytochrome c5 [Nitrosospira sp. Nsp5]|uniref:Cytochrome c5 n=1 Tax=Nitrosospira multiformis TaxID=1231 RepID=A0ABY0T6A6_9PROT|nr:MULTISPECIES: c-type cytochrome [Nitrosospira]PTR05712.1 cytochrome c5 [Nitrosospira sp. Nsp5]SDQ31914.1 Cytochrome c5 [Nitrosospira multiformis]